MDLDTLNNLDPRAVGRELRSARKRRGLTQEDAARLLGAARTTVTAIEKGERRVRPGELITLARAYGREVSDFVRDRPTPDLELADVVLPALASESDRAEVVSAIHLLIEHARNYCELENITSARLAHKYPPERALGRVRPEAAAADAAHEERLRLGLGDGPLPVLRDLLEQEIGLRVFYLPFESPGLAAVYVYDANLGGCMAVNRGCQEEQRRLALAHVYGHFLTQRHRVEVLLQPAGRRQPRGAAFAASFARHFLMPAAGIRRRWNDRLRHGRPSMADLSWLANYYGVPRDALAQQLQALGLLGGKAQRSRHNHVLELHETRADYHASPWPGRDDTTPRRYQYLALEALQRELISEGQFARFLGVDRVEARRMAEILASAGGVAGDATNQDLAQWLDLPTRE